MKLIKRITFTALIVLSIAGCKDNKGDKFIGKWTCTDCTYEQSLSISKDDAVFHVDLRTLRPRTVLDKELVEKVKNLEAKAESDSVLSLINSNSGTLRLENNTIKYDNKTYSSSK